MACRRGDGDYFWAQDRVRTRLSKAPVLWRSKKVAAVRYLGRGGPPSADRRTQRSSSKRSTFSGSFAGDGSESDQARVSDRVNALSNLEATDYDLMAPMTAEMGSAEIVLRADEEGGEPEELIFTFFAPLSEGGRAMVRVSGRETLMGVDAGAVESILADFGDLRPSVEIERDPAAE